MGLDLFPSLTFSRGDDLPQGLETVTSFDARNLSHLLEELGECSLWRRLHESMVYDEALEFAEELFVAADRLERESHSPHPKRAGEEPQGGTEELQSPDWVEKMNATYAEAIESIRAAARWYKRVGQLELDVKASI